MENTLPFENALKILLEVFTKLKLDFCIIGGIAAQIHGEPRFTRDIDIAILAQLDSLEQLVDRLLSHFTPRFSDAKELALQAQILPVLVEGIDVDITLGLTGFETQVLSNSKLFEWLPGLRLPICSKEDLAIMKALAGRERDIMDLRAIIKKNGSDINYKYIEETLNKLSQALDDPASLTLFQSIWEKEYKH